MARRDWNSRRSILADLDGGRGGFDGPRLAVSMEMPDSVPTVMLLPNAEDAGMLGLQEAYDRDQQEKFEEDLSVLYVALTRAKSFLDVVLPTDDKPKLTLSGIIRDRWNHLEAGIHLIDQCPAQAVQQTASPADLVGRDPGIWESVHGLHIPSFQSVPKRMDSITPSGQEGGGMVKLGLLLKKGNAQALERGTAVHALLSKIEWIESLPSQDDWVDSIAQHEANLEACKIAARELYPRLRNAKDSLAKVFDAKGWIERWKADKVTRLEVWRERRFAAIVVQDLMNGSFDRVVLAFNAAGKLVRADILDFKTDRVTDEKEREERQLHYQPQLDAYVKALQKLTTLPESAIRANLIWIN